MLVTTFFRLVVVMITIKMLKSNGKHWQKTTGHDNSYEKQNDCATFAIFLIRWMYINEMIEYIHIFIWYSPSSLYLWTWKPLERITVHRNTAIPIPRLVVGEKTTKWKIKYVHVFIITIICEFRMKRKLPFVFFCLTHSSTSPSYFPDTAQSQCGRSTCRRIFRHVNEWRRWYLLYSTPLLRVVVCTVYLYGKLFV